MTFLTWVFSLEDKASLWRMIELPSTGIVGTWLNALQLLDSLKHCGRVQTLRLQILLHSKFWDVIDLLHILLILPVIPPLRGMRFDGDEISGQILALLESSKGEEAG